MPPVNIKSVYSFSSEDPLYPASSLLSLNPPSTGRKWKCEFSGEKSAQVVLQLEQPSIISGIDIGNAHSAYVQVFVAKSCSSEYKQILLTSIFMSPIESRNSEPTNRVLCFGKSALDEDVSKQKWEFVKIICSQPYNKHVQYGLSFIKLHSAVEAKENNAASSSISIGNFKIREDSPDSESESPQSLFSRWKMSLNHSDSKGALSTTLAPLSAAAAIRHASTPTSLKNQTFHINRTKITPKEHKTNQQNDDDAINHKNRNRSQLMYEDEDDKPNEKLDKIIHKEKERIEREKLEKKNVEKKGKQDSNGTRSPNVTTKFKDFVDQTPSSSSSSSSAVTSKLITKDTGKPTFNEEKRSVKNVDSASTSRSKRQSSPMIDVPSLKRIKETKERVYQPFKKLLEGVVLVISGIQNPIRATIRQQAMDMGAKYKPDWEANCTHLICAFKNTPKYNQVHGHGKIITKDWISQCHSKKMRLPWRRFALDSDDANGSESEDEIYDISMKPTRSSNAFTDHKKPAASPNKSSQDGSRSHSTTPKNRKSTKEFQQILSSDDESPDRYNLKSSRAERNEFVSSGSDTEDEIRRVLGKKASEIATKKIRKSSSSDDIYNVTTEEEKETNTNNHRSDANPVTPLPEFFKGKRFYVSSNVSSTDEIKLKRFIDIYGGQLTTISPDADYIISNSPKQTPSGYKGEVVKPLWIFECNHLEMLLPTNRYNFSDW